MEMKLPTRQRILVSADDFGLSKRANRNILFLLQMGKIDRVSIFAEGEYGPEEIAALSRSGAKLDLHLKLPHDSSDAKNFLLRISRFLIFACRKKPSLEIRQEWERQIRIFQKRFGRLPDGLTSHEHVHFFPPYLSSVLALAKENTIPFVRFGKEGILFAPRAVSLTLRLLNLLGRKKFIQSATVSSAYLASLDWYKNPSKLLDEPRSGVVELVCHPERAEEFTILKNGLI